MNIIARYCGLKPQETDCVAGTGLTWVGLGDEHEVSVEAAAIMAKHPDVWELIETEDEAAPEGSGLSAVAPEVPKKNKGGRPKRA